ncbi:transglycosylase family protein [Streptomyces sp. TRM76323]|uniref:Transglycosylase family protein n=1 Tax=Streptomyces tamarix TaxID=3078565 RepID=A0ABU3QUR1_9ACTN|nr:transglycosylase family protein [Streptomyces tamarix]MDT9686194.1 transglycosylase family protein [Streptomyces tamarix]
MPKQPKPSRTPRARVRAAAPASAALFALAVALAPVPALPGEAVAWASPPSASALPAVPTALTASASAVPAGGRRAGAATSADCPGDWPWGCVALCESGGRWNANTGNGFYGGLQFKQSTWEEFGGLAYARRADLASRVQQITVAQEVLRWQGWSAWPTCSRRYGLSGRYHTVQPGDTLSTVARRFGVPGGWRALHAANRDVVGGDPNVLRPGWMLRLP